MTNAEALNLKAGDKVKQNCYAFEKLGYDDEAILTIKTVDLVAYDGKVYGLKLRFEEFNKGELFLTYEGDPDDTISFSCEHLTLVDEYSSDDFVEISVLFKTGAEKTFEITKEQWDDIRNRLVVTIVTDDAIINLDDNYSSIIKVRG